MTSWDELRTALYVHELGSVSAAAAALGVHRATVIRHIDSLEEELQVAIFVRSTTGYVATEVGNETLAAAKQADTLFKGAIRKIHGDEPSEAKTHIRISILPAFADLILPGIREFLLYRTDVVIDLQDSERVTRLDFGEADLGLRAGPEPTSPGFVAKPIMKMSLGMYATHEYITKHGAPKSIDSINGHPLVGPSSKPHMPFVAWSRRHFSPENVRLTVDGGALALDSTLAGIGIGILPDFLARSKPELQLLFKLPEALDEMLWLVTHQSNKQYRVVTELIEYIERHTSSSAANEDFAA